MAVCRWDKLGIASGPAIPRVSVRPNYQFLITNSTGPCGPVFPFAIPRGACLLTRFAVNEPTPPAAPIPNVLAERYASAAIKDIWSQQGRVAQERDF